MDFTNAYSKLTQEVEDQEATTYMVMPASEFQDRAMDVKGVLDLLHSLMFGGRASSVRYAENTKSTEEPTFVDIISNVGLLYMLDMIAEHLPNPTLRTSDKTETISIEIINNFVKTAAAALAPELVDMSSLTEEQIAQTTKMFVDALTKMINIKTLKASFSIYDGKIISGITADIDVLISLVGDDGIVASTMDIDADANVKIKELGANDTIKYPADLGEWASRMEASVA